MTPFNRLIAQSLDSLKQLLSQPIELAEKGVLYNVLTWETQQQQDDSALEIARLALQFTQQHQLDQAIITAELQLADILRSQTDFEACAIHLSKAKTLIKKGSFKKEAIRLLFFEGNLAYSQYKDEEAIHLFEKCYPLSKENYTSLCFDICFNLATLYRSQSGYKKAQNYLQLALEYSKNIAQKIKVQTSFGNLYTQQQNYQKALEFYQKNASLSISTHSELGESDAYLSIGNIHLIKSRWVKALQFYLKSATIKEKISDQLGLAELHQNIAVVYENLERHDKSIEYYTKSEAYYKTTADTTNLIETWSNIAAIYIAQNKYQQAIQLLKQAATNLKNYPSPPISLVVHMNLGFVYMQTKEYSKALIYFDESLIKAQKQQNKLLLTNIYNYHGANYFYLKDYPTSISYYKKALDLSKELALIEKQKSALFGLYESNEYLSNTKEALEWHKEYVALKDSLYNTETTNRISELQEQYDTKQKERDIQQLNIENKNIALESVLKTKQLNQFFLVIIFGALAIFFLGLLWRYRNKQQKERTIHTKVLHEKKVNQMINQQEIEMLDAVVDAQQKERKGVAKEIHDTLGSFLATLKYQHEAGKELTSSSADNQEQYQLMEQLIGQTAKEVRSIAHQMATGEKFDFDLQATIEQLVNRIRNTQQFDLQFNYLGATFALPRELELTLYRVIQELLSNVLKHANATEAMLQINQSETEITLMVEDNGAGFTAKPSKTKEGLGLHSIRERIEQFNGQVNIDSHPKHGTTIIINIPIS
jgi:signal transduction histidine kinase